MPNMKKGFYTAVSLFTVITFGFTTSAVALPEGEAVEHGQVSFQRPDASTLHVTASDQAVISWNSFNIASGETVQFFQPNLSAQAFNQILSGRESLIAGNLFANGSLFLINPAGIH
ncbi:MAG: filamentous hemagglutinin N-terminal domain-containing protein, partial [Candidatus Omnitrophica bacterium]|nr:filamentous hemagglutinin N-terminal domain-containing protein [Candidatus Omnitrophota bacterium]